MNEGMTNAEFNAFLETLAQLVESKAKTPAESAEIIPLLRMKKHFCHPYRQDPLNYPNGKLQR